MFAIASYIFDSS